MINLEKRLKTIADFVPKCHSFADIGANHGRLSAYLLENGLCDRAQITDISSASLDKARVLIEKLELTHRVSIIVGDGAQALVEKPDCAVIAGMGGILISGIVTRGYDVLRDSLIIAQPNVGIYEMRKRLTLAGFSIQDEAVVSSFGRWYVVIAMRAGEAHYDETELMAGPVLLKRGGADFKAYAAFRKKVAQSALRDEREGDDEPTVAMRKELAIWNEVEKCL